MATSLGQAVVQTLAYSRRFGLPLTAQKLHHWLITPRPVSPQSLAPFIPRLSAKDKRLLDQRALYTARKLSRAKKVARLLGLCPTIKLICATGSLAVDNAKQYDDLDIMIVTSADTLWFTRLLILIFLKIFGLRRPPSLPEHQSRRVSDKICDNLWLDETALSLPLNKRNLYTAHEVLQAKPLFDRGDTYSRFILANSWTKKYLANAYKLVTLKTASLAKVSPGTVDRTRDSSQVKQLTPPRWNFLALPNCLAFRLQYHYMKSKITRETITLHSAYFHPNEYPMTGM